MRFPRLLRFLSGFLISLGLSLCLLPALAQSPPSGVGLVDQAQQRFDQGDITGAIAAYQTALTQFQRNSSSNQNNIAITATNLCQLQLRQGQADAAQQSCQLALATLNADSPHRPSVHQAYLEALRQLGFYQQACVMAAAQAGLQNRVCEQTQLWVLADRLKSLDPGTNLTAWGQLANALRDVGQLYNAQIILEALASPQRPELLLSLGNVYGALGNVERERNQSPRYTYLPWQGIFDPLPKSDQTFYQRALTTYQGLPPNADKTLKLKADLNRLTILLALQKYADGDRLARSLNLEPLTDPVLGIQARLLQAEAQTRFRQQTPHADYQDILTTLEQITKQASSLGNDRLMALTLGKLGGFYEFLSQQPRYRPQQATLQQQAVKTTQNALYLSQNNPELAFQWQWQLARLATAQNQPDAALNHYQTAIATVDTVRKDLLTLSPDQQFSFRDHVEPLYRGYIQALIRQTPQRDQSQTLAQIIQQVEKLQLAELENFLQCDLSGQESDFQGLDENTLVIYPIQLADQLVIIYQTADATGYQTVGVSSQQMAATLAPLLLNLQKRGNTAEILAEASKVYQWLIAPLEPVLENQPGLKTLAFILDGQLRNVPMGVLYDGSQYLVEKPWAIAVVPSLQLLQTSAKTTKAMLAGGVEVAQTIGDELTVEVEAIADFQRELDNIAQFNDQTTALTNEAFTKVNIQRQLNDQPVSIIHWKTHGVFSSNPDQTYLVAYNELIRPKELSQLLYQQNAPDATIDLLVLSACESAQGDNRAVLGLAGIALRAGASTTISTLWKAEDMANTELMTAFYRQLSQPDTSKAEALHQAQQAIFAQDPDPSVWGNYILVGNWQ